MCSREQGEGGQAVKRQPPPTTIRKQTNPATTPTTTTTRMYTSLSLCLLRATCASDVAMICIEVWHKKQNTSCQPGKGPARQQQEEEEAGCGAELCAACFYDTYATFWFGPQVTRAVGGRRPLPIYTLIHMRVNIITNKETGEWGRRVFGFNLVVVGVGLVVAVAERFALFIVVADRSQNIIEICQTARF